MDMHVRDCFAINATVGHVISVTRTYPNSTTSLKDEHTERVSETRLEVVDPCLG